MKEGRKSSGSKRRLHSRLFYLVVITSLSFLISLAVYNMFFLEDREWTAIILDQLTIKKELVNSIFNSTCASILGSSGYNLQYYPGEDATISFFKDLPAKSGKVIIIRAHSAIRDGTDWVDLFTSESFRDGKYVDLALSGQISKAKMYSFDDDYFAIGPTFVNSSMKGQFEDGSLIILMGCNSLNSTSMAKALVGRGARVVVGWTSWVDANYTDSYTLQLLQYLFAENPYTVRGSINKLNMDMNSNNQSNPYKTRLTYYPTSDEAANYILPSKIEPLNSASLPATLLIHVILCQIFVAKRDIELIDQPNLNLVSES